MTLRKKVMFVMTAFVVIVVALVGCASLTVRSQTGTRDHLVGWFKMQGNDTIIPVFKIEGTYYSVCFPGIEVPLKECPEKGEKIWTQHRNYWKLQSHF